MRRALFLVAVSFAIPIAAQEQVKLDSKVLGEKRTVLVRTPASYATGSRAYPVLYMTDGDRHIEHTAAVVDFLAREGRMPEVIIVGINNTDRTRDLTPTTVPRMGEGQGFGTPTSGGADRFLDFIATELIPYVEKNYRTRPYRVFAGHSFGGLFGMHAFLTRPALFNAVIAASPTLTWDDRYVYRRAVEWAKTTPTRPATLVLTVGNEGEALDRELDALRELLKSAPKDIEWEVLRFADEDHGSVVLPTHYAGLRKVFEPMRFALGRDDDPKTLFTKARDHYARASARFGFQIAIPEATQNNIGYRLLQAGHVQEAIEVFRDNATAWPDSANVYDSLAEAQERAGDLKSAVANYGRAAAIGRKKGDPNTGVFETNRKRVEATMAGKR